MLEIVGSTCASIRHGEFDLKVLAQACASTGAGLNVTVKCGGGRQFDVWIAMVHYSSHVSPLSDAAEVCEEFFTNTQKMSHDHLIITFSTEIQVPDETQMTKPKFFFLAGFGLEKSNSESNNGRTSCSIDEKTEEENPLILSLDTIPARIPISRTRMALVGAFMTFGIVLLGIFTYQSWRPARYERYPTPGSIGPKHQSRLLYNNATSWARQVGFDDTKWRIRIDDQALVPAHLYSTDEDRYQRWFRQRYPHLQEIIERHDYLRPSWLGSSQIAVPWDEQFHFAHCVLALRRYWVAKETGAHLCGRDIDYAHMKHCLDSLDEKAFPPGPMEDVGKGYRLWWQTKVCYD